MVPLTSALPPESAAGIFPAQAAPAVVLFMCRSQSYLKPKVPQESRISPFSPLFVAEVPEN